MTPSTLLIRFALPLVLMASVAVAGERESVVRNVLLPAEPVDEARAVHVAGGVATVLRFETPCDPARTKLLGWEGRFEPLLVGGKKVVIEPLQDLSPEDRFLLLVTLADGTELPFTVTAREDRVDHQVNLFPDPETQRALRASLTNALGRERRYREELERSREEKTSVDHALAALVVKDALKLTPFRHQRTWRLPSDGVEIKIQSYTSLDKTAVRFYVTNQARKTPWRLKEARLMTATSLEARPFALRLDQEEIAPGATGAIAVVLDSSAFESKAAQTGVEQLVLELYRADGMQEVFVVLELEQQNPRK